MMKRGNSVNQPPIENLMRNTLDQLKSMIDVDTVVGDAVTMLDGGVIIPVSKVSYGFFAGGGEYGSKEQSQGAGYPFVGGAGAGVSITPQAFLVVKDQVRLMPVQCNTAYDRIIEMIPNLIQDIQKWLEIKKNSETTDIQDMAT